MTCTQRHSERVWAWTCVPLLLCVCVGVSFASLTTHTDDNSNNKSNITTAKDYGSRSSGSGGGSVGGGDIVSDQESIVREDSMVVSIDGTDTNVGNSDIKESDGVDGEVGEDSWSGSEVRDSSSSGDHSNYQDPLEDSRLGTWGVGVDYDHDRGVSRMAPSPRRTVEVTRDSGLTNTEVMVRCLSTPTILFPNIPTSSPLNHGPSNPMAYNPPYDDDDGGDKVDEDGSDILGEDEVKSELLVKDAAGSGRGIEVDLTQLVDAAVGGQLVVDVEGCGPVGVGVGIPGWAEGVTFAIKGTLLLRREWWRGGVGLKEMWLRVNGGLTRAEGEETDGVVGEGDLCHSLPPTLQVLDITHTPTREFASGGVMCPSQPGATGGQGM
ncbi:hypothetical protein Pcinc_022319 [Petrolisthes cinctipes]|uniref:Uncharacterized protein n=1 Tax=Petrolisthes cinctipes TaxID=88211 RepID=A0AAE1KHA2_PETCI|nr:hypothetical protein Pcinc_022319 [Petrolisthes cinctipes]